MRKVTWFQQSETWEGDDPECGLYSTEIGEVAATEGKVMEQGGVSKEEIAKIEWISCQAEDRDSATITAIIPWKVEEWLLNNLTDIEVEGE